MSGYATIRQLDNIVFSDIGRNKIVKIPGINEQIVSAYNSGKPLMQAITVNIDGKIYRGVIDSIAKQSDTTYEISSLVTPDILFTADITIYPGFEDEFRYSVEG